MDNEEQKPKLTFLDRYLDIDEPKVTYLTKITWIDRILAASVLQLIPWNVRPNVITRFRLILIPFIAGFLITNHFFIGMVLFLFAAFSDALDGAMARTRHQITAWGTLYDPISDKLLIGITSLIIVSKYLSLDLAFVICFIEICLVSSAYFRYKGRIVPAKTMGKTKMVLQCLGLIVLLVGIIASAPIMLLIAQYILYLAIVFALLSLFIFRSI
jgi:CDP-diacylglycerol--glycerol-3-phosphate 3-phosphatidyltransferase